jgi:uncharacterized membrane protein YeaQ/YmgE (transglycosylase-associated protein family)
VNHHAPQDLGTHRSNIMGLLLFLVFGFVIGLLARAIMPGDQKMGILATTALGVAGSFAGGFLASLVTDTRITDFSTAGAIGSIIGALILLGIFAAVARRRGGHRLAT